MVNNLEQFNVMVDSETGMGGLIATPLDNGKTWSVFVEVDCGYGRCKQIKGYFITV